MRRVIRFRAEEIVPAEADVLRRLEVPPESRSALRVRTLLEQAEQLALELFEARGVMQEIDAAAFMDVYDSEGPLQTIAQSADSLALFAGTLGERAEQRIAKAFRDDDPALAVALDAVASEAANRVAYRLATEFGGGKSTLPYSPGYCGWHVSGQRALFAALEPWDIGVTLKPSCLMTPVKSVSGVLVAGDAAAHRFRPDYAFCDECDTQECVARMASLRR